MKIKASCGNAPRDKGIKGEVYSIDLRAETHGERQLLAGLLPELSAFARQAILAKGPPVVRISVEKDLESAV